jgi:transposase InsO family protein
VRYAFIESVRGKLGVHALCRLLSVSRSGYYDWVERAESERVRRDRQLLDEIQRVHEASRQAYGAVKTWRALLSQGIACGKHRVARLRKQAGIEARRKRRFRITVEHHYSAPAAPNLIKQRFQAARPDRIWVGDMTVIRTREGFLHLAVLLDLYSRKVVGWAMSARPTLAVALNALRMALIHRQPHPGLIHHTDRGQLYRARAYLETLGAHEVSASMSAKGNTYDNAVAESFFSNMKNELVHHCDFRSREQARMAIFEYIECFYNPQRLHQTLGYVSPVQFEMMNGVC